MVTPPPCAQACDQRVQAGRVDPAVQPPVDLDGGPERAVAEAEDLVERDAAVRRRAAEARRRGDLGVRRESCPPTDWQASARQTRTWTGPAAAERKSR